MFFNNRAIKILVAGLSVVALTVGTTSLASAHRLGPIQRADIQAQSSHTEYAEWLTVQMINQERANAGLAPVAMQYNIHQYARTHSINMASQGRLWHDMNSYSRSVPGGTTSYGENAAYNYSIQAAHVALMKSPGHRANILNRNFTHVGVGVRYTPDGKVFVSENFAAVHR